jgi:hypothetical protein
MDRGARPLSRAFVLRCQHDVFVAYDKCATVIPSLFENSTSYVPPEALVLGPERRTPIEGTVLLWESVDGVSQLGGHPTWEQDAGYSDCPQCHLPMRFVGPVKHGEIETAEGTTYAFLCAGCLIAATGYQQT